MKSKGIYDMKLILINNASKNIIVKIERKIFIIIFLCFKNEEIRPMILDIKKAEDIIRLKLLVIFSPEKNLNKISKYIRLKKVVKKANICLF